MLVDVTSADIHNGKRGEACNCPVALAIKRLAPSKTVNVGILHAFFDPELNEGKELPTEAKEFIKAFDAGEPVSPFTFFLDYSEQS